MNHLARPLLAIVLTLWPWSAPADAQGRCPSLDRVVVVPSSPKPRSLVRLRVKLTNSTDRTVDGMRFSVLLDGKPLPGYRKLHYFGHIVAPGKSVHVNLHNFWTPGAGEHTLAVVLREVYRVTLRRRGKTTTTTLRGRVTCKPEGRIVLKLNL